METGYPDVRAQPLLGARNLSNALLVVVLPVPAIVCCWALFHWFSPGEIPPSVSWREVSSLDQLAALLLHRPVLSANLLYFVFVDLVFFAIALLQRSSWLIDPYWTLLPLLLGWFYLAHPLAEPDWGRIALTSLPLAIWSARLTFNYFRREAWRFGLREDWRYARMRRERPHFWLEQFAIVQLAQHAMLVGLCLPLYAVSFHPEPLGTLDFVLLAGATAGIAIAGVADNQLDQFMRSNADRTARGEARIELLDSGIWRYSRHPNYFGEQLFWWSIAGFGVVCGQPWVIIGTAFNSCVLAGVTVMTERRMLQVASRAKLYADYQRRTSAWIPWPPRTLPDETNAERSERSA